MRIDARSVSVQTSQIEHVESVTGQSDDILGLIRDMARRLNTGLRLGPAVEPSANESPAPAPPAPDAVPRASPFQAIAVYSRALTEDDNRNAAQALALYRQFLGMAPQGFAASQRAYAEQRVKALGGGGF
jgi:hypothetical protein